MTTDLARLGRSTYLQLTTFRRDGTPVPTPVWVAADPDTETHTLLVWTRADAGKVKRVRNNGAVEVAECDFRGRARGEVLTGTARLLDSAGSERGRRILKRKYGLSGRLVISSSVLRRGRDGTLCMAITLD